MHNDMKDPQQPLESVQVAVPRMLQCRMFDRTCWAASFVASPYSLSTM